MGQEKRTYWVSKRRVEKSEGTRRAGRREGGWSGKGTGSYAWRARRGAASRARSARQLGNASSASSGAITYDALAAWPCSKAEAKTEAKAKAKSCCAQAESSGQAQGAGGQGKAESCKAQGSY